MAEDVSKPKPRAETESPPYPDDTLTDNDDERARNLARILTSHSPQSENYYFRDVCSFQPSQPQVFERMIDLLVRIEYSGFCEPPVMSRRLRSLVHYDRADLIGLLSRIQPSFNGDRPEADGSEDIDLESSGLSLIAEVAVARKDAAKAIFEGGARAASKSNRDKAVEDDAKSAEERSLESLIAWFDSTLEVAKETQSQFTQLTAQVAQINERIDVHLKGGTDTESK